MTDDEGEGGSAGELSESLDPKSELTPHLIPLPRRLLAGCLAAMGGRGVCGTERRALLVWRMRRECGWQARGRLGDGVEERAQVERLAEDPNSQQI
jgi:hypothetical protein